MTLVAFSPEAYHWVLLTSNNKTTQENAMNDFIAKHHNEINGVLTGFDRLVFHGNLRALCGLQGMESYLATNRVLYKDFSQHVEQVSRQIKEASLARAQREGRTIEYVAPSADKQKMAQAIATEQNITKGLICVLTSVEPCFSFTIFKNRETKQLEMQQRRRQCLHIYQYWQHPVFGFLNARIQTWFPFRVQICINGREWLARQMDKAGMKYLRQDNCFPWVEDFQQAQKLMDLQLRTHWAKSLQNLAGELNPIHEKIFDKFHIHYYWSVFQSEWAIDVVFRDAGLLRRLYPKMVLHAMTSFGSADVMRYLGRRVPASGLVNKNFCGEILSDLKQRPEGMRVKHGVNKNTVKAYDKAFTPLGSVLRFETTIHNGDDFRVYRRKEGDPNGPLAMRKMRRSVADLYRRADISNKAAERYMNAMATVDDGTTLEELSKHLENPVSWNGRRVRGLRLFDAADRQLLEAVNRGEFTINGLRNRDLQRLLFSQPPASPREARRRCAWVSRKLRLLRAHKLLDKIHHTHRYHVSKNGRYIITALLTAFRTTLAQLTAVAA
jgi:hypothetical protein